jgi:LysM repeat protein
MSYPFQQALAPTTPAGTDTTPHDTLRDYNRFPWLLPQYDMIQFYNKQSLDHFVKSWEQTKNKKMSIVHLGDSHLQTDLFPGRMRKNLQAIHGDGGRGIMFSYSAANTYSSVEYATTSKGDWTYGKALIIPPKLPLGVSGMTVKTLDSTASLTFTLKNAVPTNYSKLKIFCKKDSISYDLRVECGGQLIHVPVDSTPGDTLPYYEITLPQFTNEIILHTERDHKCESEFVFYGMSLETPDSSGVIYHNCGVGGARYESILYEDLFSGQLPSLNPDLVIIDFGTNDYLYDDSIKANQEATIIKVVDKVRAAAPNASIILTTTMDLYCKGDHATSGQAFSDLIKKVARNENCGVWDWYWIAGGWNVMPLFQSHHLANPDGVHNTASGYRLKGNLFSDAMVNTVAYIEKNPDKDSLVFQFDSLKAIQLAIKLREDSDSVPADVKRIKVVYKMHKKETLGMVAKKFHVTVAEIRKWNNMQSNAVHTGKVIWVYCDPKYKPKPPAKKKPVTKPKPK